MAKYLGGGIRRMEQVFPSGRGDGVMCAYSDPDGAGRLRTRKSTSGRVLCTKGLIEAKGVESLGRDFGDDLRVDTKATIGFSCRAGVGKADQIDMAELWIQDALDRPEDELADVGGERNRAYVLRAVVPQDTAKRHLIVLRCFVVPSGVHPNRRGPRGHAHSCACPSRSACAVQPADECKRPNSRMGCRWGSRAHWQAKSSQIVSVSVSLRCFLCVRVRGDDIGRCT